MSPFLLLHYSFSYPCCNLAHSRYSSIIPCVSPLFLFLQSFQLHTFLPQLHLSPFLSHVCLSHHLGLTSRDYLSSQINAYISLPRSIPPPYSSILCTLLTSIIPLHHFNFSYLVIFHLTTFPFTLPSVLPYFNLSLFHLTVILQCTTLVLSCSHLSIPGILHSLYNLLPSHSH